MSKLDHIHQFANGLVKDFYWTNTYGLARTLLAMGTLLTLFSNNIIDLIEPMGTRGKIDDYHSLAELSLFNLFPDQIELIRYLCVFVLILVIIGWRPRVTGFFHWWVSFSFVNSATVVDGGDQITGLFTLLLLPICLIDARKSHWNIQAPIPVFRYWQKVGILAVLSCFFIIRLQVAFVYFHASVGKMGVEEWSNGTAVYYWFNHPNFGLTPLLKVICMPLLTNPFTVTLISWGTILFELMLFLGLMFPQKWRMQLLYAGLFFHFMIIIVHGLVSFFFAMAAVLLLYLGPIQTGINFPALLQNLIPFHIPLLSNRKLSSKVTS